MDSVGRTPMCCPRIAPLRCLFPHEAKPRRFQAPPPHELKDTLVLNDPGRLLLKAVQIVRRILGKRRGDCDECMIACLLARASILPEGPFSYKSPIMKISHSFSWADFPPVAAQATQRAVNSLGKVSSPVLFTSVPHPSPRLRVAARFLVRRAAAQFERIAKSTPMRLAHW